MQERSQETRTQITAAASRLFSQFGYDATGVAEICAQAGISKGAFYHHFPSKHAVFMALLEEWLVGLDKQIVFFGRSGRPAAETLLGMGSMLEFIFHSASGQLPLFLEFWAQASRDKSVWQTTIAPYHRFHHQFTQLVERGVQDGSLHTSDPQATAWVILALATGILLQGLLDPQAAAWDKVGKHGLQILINGLEREH